MIISFSLGRKSEIDETQIGDPIYDSSPSGTDKPTSMGSPIDAVFLQEGNQRLKGLDFTVNIAFRSFS
jgi:hypothetical protein